MNRDHVLVHSTTDGDLQSRWQSLSSFFDANPKTLVKLNPTPNQYITQTFPKRAGISH